MKSNSYSNQASFGDSTNNFGGVDDAKARLMSLGNKKGISSEDIFGEREIKSQEVKDKYASLTGARAISSDMFFGSIDGGKDDDGDGFQMGKNSYNKSKQMNNELIFIFIDYAGSGNYDEYKEQASKMAEKVQESAKFYKDKALDWFT